MYIVRKRVYSDVPETDLSVIISHSVVTLKYHLQFCLVISRHVYYTISIMYYFSLDP